MLFHCTSVRTMHTLPRARLLTYVHFCFPVRRCYGGVVETYLCISLQSRKRFLALIMIKNNNIYCANFCRLKRVERERGRKRGLAHAHTHAHTSFLSFCLFSIRYLSLSFLPVQHSSLPYIVAEPFSFTAYHTREIFLLNMD